jgi:4'-phosphopantetheinyl transferase
MMAVDAKFSYPTQFPNLNRTEIHIWQARLDLIPHALQSLLLTLSSDERGRSERFRFAKDRNRYVIARGILRALLGDYLGVPPASLRFSYGSFGKPFLAPESLPYPIHFSVSHSCGLAVFGFSQDQEIGIDLERIRMDFEFEQIAKSFFPSGEFSGLHSLVASGRFVDFFRVWTCLEAYAKARGTGLCLFDGSGAPFPAQAAPVSQSVGNHCQEISNWEVEHFTPESNYIAALAVRKSGSSLKFWKYTEQTEMLF